MKIFADNLKNRQEPHRRLPVLPALPCSSAISCRQEIRQILRSRIIQPRLVVDATNDDLEQEADRVADQVMRMPEIPLPDQAGAQEQFSNIQSAVGDVMQCPDSVRKGEAGSILQAKGDESAADIPPLTASYINDLEGSGQQLDPGARAYFQPRFGVNFDHVRVHADGRAAASAQAIEAQAYTYGNHVVFAQGRYAPESESGKLLLAHELTHVVQQSADGGPLSLPLHTLSAEPAIQCKDAAPAPGETPETAIMSPWNGILRGGLLGRIASESLLMDLYGPQQTDALANAIRRNAEALAFVREYSGFNAVRPVVALVDTRRSDGGFDVARARQAVIHLSLAVLDARVSRQKSEKSRQTDAQSLAELQTWAEAQQKQQGVIDPAAVVGLDQARSSALSAVRSRLAALGSTGPRAAGVLSEVARGIHGVVEDNEEGGLRHALPRLRSDDDLYRLQGLVSVQKAQMRLRELLRKMPEVLALVDVDTLAFSLQDELRRLWGSVSGREVDVGIVEQVRDNLKALQRRFSENAATLGQGQGSSARLDFVFRCLLWLNGVPGATAPTTEEAGQLAGLLRTTVEDDLLRLFPSLNSSQIKLLHAFGESILPLQLEARQMMQATGHLPAGAVPTLAEGRGWFGSLRGRSNAELVRAYEAFAGAWFYHRLVASLEDMAEPTIESLFERQASITGRRPLVCSGYALLGATLLQAAGARLQHYTMAVRATDQQIRNNSIDSGHAIAVLRRNGATLIVSNDTVVDNENAAIGPDAVAWQNAQATLHRANGSTLARAKHALEGILSGIANR
ncbi:MAG: DUF4157 domain-containing protein [Geobacteraceae bacterium]|nr:DUF4157 domain-containing protein [Geobacteraceae bacterium]